MVRWVIQSWFLSQHTVVSVRKGHPTSKLQCHNGIRVKCVWSCDYNIQQFIQIIAFFRDTHSHPYPFVEVYLYISAIILFLFLYILLKDNASFHGLLQWIMVNELHTYQASHCSCVPFFLLKVIHNYGHEGVGVGLSYGSASKVTRILSEALGQSDTSSKLWGQD